MTTEELLSAIRKNPRNGRPVIYPLFESIAYSLHKAGYHRKFIADAMRVHPDSVSYMVETARGHIETGDERVIRAMKEIAQHDFVLLPYFDMSGKGGTSKIRTDLYIDTIKY